MKLTFAEPGWRYRVVWHCPECGRHRLTVWWEDDGNAPRDRTCRCGMTFRIWPGGRVEAIA